MVQILPPEEKQPQHPLGMARIINAKEVLQIYAAAFPEDEMQLELSDKQLSVNNGYLVREGLSSNEFITQKSLSRRSSSRTK